MSGPAGRLPPSLRGTGRLLAALLVLALLGAGVFRALPLRTEMSDFLPPAETPAAAFLLEELRSGAATTLLLVGIEGAPEGELARLSRALGDSLRASGRFAFVGNGALDLSDAERELVFRQRYLLSASVTPALFEVPALRAKLTALLDGLRSAASPVLARFGFADPVGAFLDLLRGWLGQSRVELRQGVWFAAKGENGEGPPRALLVARSTASGLDTEGQRLAAQAVRDGFAHAGPGSARLLLSGPGVFAAEAAAAVKSDVEMISVLSGLLIAGFLFWRTRSLRMLLVVAVPLAAGTLAAAAVTAAAFGHLHGAALGFGMTMLGVAVDYPILLVTQRRPEETLPEAARRIWPTLRLAALAAALGLVAMLASGFPGLAQLGLFGAVGLLVGVAVTRWGLPRLMPEGALETRPLPGPLARALAAMQGRRWGYGLIGLAALALALSGGPRWEDDLANLSPVPQAQRDLDTELRGQLGAPDVRVLVALRGDTAEAVLRRSERVEAALAPLVAAGTLAGLDLPSRYLPSAAAQYARQAALPDPAVLRARLAEAGAGLPFRANAFAPFLAAVAESRTLAPLTAGALAGAPLLSARLGPLLARRGEGWQGLAVPSGLRDPAALRAAVEGLRDPAVLVVDIKGETQGMIAATTQRALLWVALGGAGVLGLLALGLRRAGRAGPVEALRVAAPIAGALVVTLAALSLLGERLTPFHLAALLLLAGVGMDYALFLNQPAPGEAADRNRAAVLTCAVTTLLTFGLLAFCGTPVLRGIGLTVAIGVTAAFLLALYLAPVWRGTPSGPDRP
ncbi:MMPL family transporter [Roseomonas sp. OT10]|uniref:MMPL family transporter n=1 Tax=Roseomonas cutis TaxID=2897332 RepID=UPI001E3D7046|nr:MMPL family transporter [Roseomonas sp. OT10]UFN48250.1 MMPL family transporter [Roseomonas sp. OT10]